MEKKEVMVFHNCLGKPMTAVTLVQLRARHRQTHGGCSQPHRGGAHLRVHGPLAGALDTPPGPLLVFFGLAISLVCRRLHCGFPW